MRMNLLKSKALATGARRTCRAGWCLIILSLLIPTLCPQSLAQDAGAAVKPAKPGDSSLLPYAGNKEAMAKLSNSPAGVISSVTANQQGRDVTVSVASNVQLTYQQFSIDGPPRLVLDFMNTENRVALMNYPVGAAGVKQVRISQFQNSDPKIARLVFDLDKDYGNHDIAADEKGMRITFHPAPTPDSDSPKVEIQPSASPATAAVAPTSQPATNDVNKPEVVPASVPAVTDAPPAANPPVALASAASEPVVRAAPSPAETKPAEAAMRAPAPPQPKAAAADSPAPARRVRSQEGNYGGQPLTLDLVNISLVDFFRLMAEEGGVNIVLDPDIKGTTSVKVEKVPWDQIFEAVLGNNGLDKQVDGNLIRIVTKKTMQAEAKQQEDLKKANLLASDVETKIRRLNYAKASTMLPILKDQLSPRGAAVVDERTGSLVVTDIPGTLDRMMKLVDGLDTPEPQVEIEARIVSATRDFARDIGIQFGFVEGNLQRVTVGGANTFGTIGGTRPSATPTTTFAGGNPITGRGASDSSSSQSGGVSTGTSSANNAGNWNVNLPSKLPFGGLGLSVGNIFDTFLLDAAITAGESKGQAKLISQPKLTTQNNSPGTITQGLRFPIQVVANNTVTVQFQNAALTLSVTPQITSEGKIVLDLKVENNTPDFGQQVQGIPSIRTSESSTRVLVMDGGTTVIGGILIDNDQTLGNRVPGLASVPLLGNLFKRTSVTHNTQEVLFFVTPRIVK